jgi:hypothetical protein
VAEVEVGAASRTGEGARGSGGGGAFRGGDTIMVSSVEGSCGAVLGPKEKAGFDPLNKFDDAGPDAFCANMDEVDGCRVLSPNVNLFEVCGVVV